MIDNDDFEIDNLLENTDIFKPLTNGLGFHHSIKEEKEVKYDLQTKSIQLKTELEQRARKLSLNTAKIESPSINMGDLSPFYQNTKPQKMELNLEPSQFENQTEESDLVIRFLAWGIDLTLVATLITIVSISVVFIANIPLSFIRTNIFNLDIFLMGSTLMGMIYVFYFSFFDKTKFSSLGKRITGIKVVNLEGNSITMVQAFLRTIVTIVSLFTLGLGSVLRIQDRLTDTKVVKA